jgi:protoheme IX farnesyltransferase
MSMVEQTTTLVTEVGPEVGLSEATAGDFIALLKPRVMSLVVFTAFVGLMAAPVPFDPLFAAIAIFSIAIGAGASGALNMWYDADIDRLMSRTARRPVPAGRMLAGEALGFGLVLSFLSVMTLGLLLNWLAASLLAFTIFFYAVIYTMWLKRWTPQNIVIGGAAGAFPPVVGWAAATGSVSLESVILFAIIFLWTPPHFWALALFKSGDYGRAGIPMMPNVAGEPSTRVQIFIYTLIIAPIGVLPWALGYTSAGYGIVAAALGAGFIYYAWGVLRMPSSDRIMLPAKRMFGFSLLYLFGIFAAYLADGLVARFLQAGGL